MARTRAESLPAAPAPRAWTGRRVRPQDLDHGGRGAACVLPRGGGASRAWEGRRARPRDVAHRWPSLHITRAAAASSVAGGGTLLCALRPLRSAAARDRARGGASGARGAGRRRGSYRQSLRLEEEVARQRREPIAARPLQRGGRAGDFGDRGAGGWSRGASFPGQGRPRRLHRGGLFSLGRPCRSSCAGARGLPWLRAPRGASGVVSRAPGCLPQDPTPEAWAPRGPSGPVAAPAPEPRLTPPGAARPPPEGETSGEPRSRAEAVKGARGCFCGCQARAGALGRKVRFLLLRRRWFRCYYGSWLWKLRNQVK